MLHPNDSLIIAAQLVFFGVCISELVGLSPSAPLIVGGYIQTSPVVGQLRMLGVFLGIAQVRQRKQHGSARLNTSGRTSFRLLVRVVAYAASNSFLPVESAIRGNRI